MCQQKPKKTCELRSEEERSNRYFYHEDDSLLGRTVTVTATGGIAQGGPYTATISDIFCVRISVHIIPNSFTRSVW